MRIGLFPGQASQDVGMGSDLFEIFPEARDMYDRADDLLGFKISTVSFEGPADTLERTSRTQPALYVHGLVIWHLIDGQGAGFEYLAGHSLGELSALAAAGAFDFETGLKLVKIRSEVMQKACDEHPGAMAALMFLPEDQLEPLLQEAGTAGLIQAANINSKKQVVVSGERKPVERAVELAREFGAKKAVLLKVNGAFHSALMSDAQAEFSEAVDAVAMHTPGIPVIPNVTAVATTDLEKIKSQLKAQLTSAVLWKKTMDCFSELGVSECYELGPKSVLQGLAKDPLAGATRAGISTVDDVNRFLEGHPAVAH